jgi:hypothetical protein
MYARVVRFTDVTPERIAEIDARVKEEQGPPPDVPAKSMRMIADEDQKTAVVVFFFDSEEDMRKADVALNEMDSSETPGTRASVDQGEVKMSTDA